MKKSKRIIKQILEELEKCGIVQVACDKVGISRNTFYRWLKEDEDFLNQVNTSITMGIGVVNDVAVSNVLEGIKRKDIVSTKYWLSHRHPDFRKPYVYKIDTEDVLARLRYMQEVGKKIMLDKKATKLETKEEEKRIQQEIKEMEEWEKMWFKDS